MISDPGLFWSLQTIDQLGSYFLFTRKVLEFEETYLDTKKRLLFLAGYSCRKRYQGKKISITLSKLHSRKGATKHWELMLKKNIPDPINWPDSQVRRRVINVVSDKKLRAIINLYQTRIMRTVRIEEKRIGRFDLDEITITTNDNKQYFKQLEIKLLPLYSDLHLEKISAAILKKWPLEVETLSKLERALALEKNAN